MLLSFLDCPHKGPVSCQRPRNATLRRPNLSTQLSLVNLFLCETFPKPFIPPLSSGSWNAGGKIHFFFPFQECVFCVLRGVGLKRKNSDLSLTHKHTYMYVYTNIHSVSDSPTEAGRQPRVGEGC